MNTAIQVIFLFTVYFLIFILGAFAGYVYGVKKGVQACMNWEDKDDKDKHNNSVL